MASTPTSPRRRPARASSSCARGPRRFRGAPSRLSHPRRASGPSTPVPPSVLRPCEPGYTMRFEPPPSRPSRTAIPVQGEGAENGRGQPLAREPRHGKTGPRLDDVAVQDHRRGQDQRHPEPAPEHRGVVGVPAVVGGAHERLPATAVLVRGRYTAALPVVPTRVRRATSHEPPLLGFAAFPGRVAPRPLAQSLTLANSIVTYIQYEYYFETQHET